MLQFYLIERRSIITYITAKNEKITRLQYGAQGFRNAFYVLFNSVFSRPGCESWLQDGNAMSVLGTNGCFSIELYLKFLMAIDSFDEQTLSGKHKLGHKLGELYDALRKQNSSWVNELEQKYNLSKHKHQYKSLGDFLNSINDYFVDWRYSYDKGALNVNLNTLSDVLNFFKEFSIKKYSKVAEVLAQHPVSNPDNQSMSIDSIDEIKKC